MRQGGLIPSNPLDSRFVRLVPERNLGLFRSQNLRAVGAGAGALGVLAVQVGGAVALWAHTSDVPAILGRYAPDYFWLVVGYHLAALVWAAAVAGILSGRLAGALRAAAVRPALFWGGLAGLWALGLGYLRATAYRGAVSPLVRTAPLLALVYAMLLLPWRQAIERLGRGRVSSQMLAGWAVLAAGTVLLAFQVAGGVGLWGHVSNVRVVLGRFALDYFAFMVSYGLMVVVWGGLVVGFALCLRRGCLDGLVERLRVLSGRGWRFGGVVAGLCAAMAAYAWVTSGRVLPAGAWSIPLATLAFATLLLVGTAIYLHLQAQHGPAGVLAVGGVLAAGLAVLALQAAGAVALWKQVIDRPAFFALLATYHLTLAGWIVGLAWLTVSIFRQRLAALEDALRRLVTRPPILWGTVAGLWALTALLLGLNACCASAEPAQMALVTAPTAARLLLLAFAAYAGVLATPAEARAGAPAEARLRDRAAHLLRRDALPLALFLEVTVLFTYPLIARLGSFLPSGNGLDVFVGVWANWWLKNAILTGGNSAFAHPFFAPSTTLLMHPNGLDLSFAGRPWLYMPTFIPLSAIFGEVFAYNVNSLLGLIGGAYFAYLLALYLTRSRAAAWIAGFVFSFWPGRLLLSFATPNAGHIELLPLFMLAFVHALRTRRLAHMALAGALLALTSYYSVKITLYAIWAGGLYALGWLARLRAWRDLRLWRGLALFSVIFVGLGSPILVPYVSDRGYLEHAVAITRIGAPANSVNLASFFVPDENFVPRIPSFIYTRLAHFFDLRLMPERPWILPYYLGYLGLVLAGLAVWPLHRSEREAHSWLMVLVVCLLLSLGSTLQVGPYILGWLPMPMRLLDRIFFVEVLRDAYRFVLPASLAWGVLIAFGVQALLRQAGGATRLGRFARLGSVCLVLMIAYYSAPLQGFPAKVSPFYEEIGRDGQSYAIVDLPISRDITAITGYYLYLQTIHGKPIAAGAVARMPADAYRYVESNALLSAWEHRRRVDCDGDGYAEALSDLKAHDFRYVVLHKDRVEILAHMFAKEMDLSIWQGYFGGVAPTFEDEQIVVYDLERLGESLPVCAGAE